MERASTRICAFDSDAVSSRLSFISLYRPYLAYLFLGLFYLLVTNMIAALLPRLVKLAVDQIVTPLESQWPVWAFTSAIVVLALVVGVLRTLSRRELFNVGRFVERDVRQFLYSHLSLLSRNFYRRKSVGDLMSHSLSDVTNIRMVAGFAVLNLFNIIFVVFVNVPILLSINAKIALFAMSPFVLAMIVAQVASAKMFKRTRENQEAQSRVSAHVQENLSGAQVVRLFGREAFEGKKFEKTNLDAYQIAMRLAFVRTIVFPLTRTMAGLGIAIVLFVGGISLHNQEISLGDFIEVNTRLLLLTWPAISVGLIISIVSQGRASLERLNVLLKDQPAVFDGLISAKIEGKVELKEVQVEDSGNRILGPISAQFPSGTLTGIVGPSGSGKSTLVSCLLRQEERMTGAVLFDGTDAKEFKLNALFAQVAAVQPEPFLFGESIRANISFANNSASQEEIESVVAIVGLGDDIARMSHGYDTLVGEKGVMLSGGQRQRVALARALIAKPRILILDDCFSAVDAETEAHIVDQLRKNRFAQTVVLVSHRLAAMRFVDNIIVLDKGKLVEQGRHEDLLDNGALYCALWGIETFKEQLGK